MELTKAERGYVELMRSYVQQNPPILLFPYEVSWLIDIIDRLTTPPTPTDHLAEGSELVDPAYLDFLSQISHE